MRSAGSERERHGAAAPALSSASARLHTAADVSVSGERMQGPGVNTDIFIGGSDQRSD